MVRGGAPAQILPQLNARERQCTQPSASSARMKCRCAYRGAVVRTGQISRAVCVSSKLIASAPTHCRLSARIPVLCDAENRATRVYRWVGWPSRRASGCAGTSRAGRGRGGGGAASDRRWAAGCCAHDPCIAAASYVRQECRPHHRAVPGPAVREGPGMKIMVRALRDSTRDAALAERGGPLREIQRPKSRSGDSGDRHREPGAARQAQRDRAPHAGGKPGAAAPPPAPREVASAPGSD